MVGGRTEPSDSLLSRSETVSRTLAAAVSLWSVWSTLQSSLGEGEPMFRRNHVMGSAADRPQHTSGLTQEARPLRMQARGGVPQLSSPLWRERRGVTPRSRSGDPSSVPHTCSLRPTAAQLWKAFLGCPGLQEATGRTSRRPQPHREAQQLQTSCPVTPGPDLQSHPSGLCGPWAALGQCQYAQPSAPWALWTSPGCSPPSPAHG